MVMRWSNAAARPADGLVEASEGENAEADEKARVAMRREKFIFNNVTLIMNM